MLTVGSLFAGIGGFDLGLERAGMRSVWQCEIDPYAIRVLEKHWPDVLRVPDIRGVGAGTVPYVDVICGGFPCQGLSDAGLQLGLADPRSALWFEMLRVIRELRPRWVVVENVAALLARGLDVVLGGLAACGYDAEWDCIPASAVGAPHRRDRVWLVAYPDSDRGRREVGGEQHRRPQQPEQQASQRDDADGFREAVADAALEPANFHSGHPSAEDREGRCELGDGGWWSAEPGMGRVAHGVPQRVDRLRSLGNALVPQIAELIGRRILEHEGAE